MEFEIKVDFKGVAKVLAVDAPRQVNFAMAKTLTALAQDGRDALAKEMPIVFDRPTGFSLKAATFEKATPASQQSRVYFKESQEAAGKSINEHLRPGAMGTPARHQKKTEFLLTRLGFLPPGWVTVPGKAMPQDANGNMAGQHYRSIINVLQLKKIETKQARGIYDKSVKRSKKMGVDVEIFCIAPGKNTRAKGGGWLPPGVYKHLPNRKLLQMLKFVRKASYDALLDVEKVVTKAVTDNAERRWVESVDFALLTAKK